MASPFSFSATHGVNNPPFTSESTPPAAAAAAAPPPKPKGFSFGISLAQEKAEPKPSIFGSSTAAPATATTGFTFGAAQQPTAPAPPAPTTSAFGGGFGAFGGGGFGTFGQPAAAAPQAAAATRPSTFGGDGGCGFGLQDSLPPSPFGSAQPSGFGIPSSFLGPSAFGAPGAFGTTHQEPSPPPPNSTSGGFGFGGGGSCFGTTALQKTEAAPSTTAAAEVAKVLTVKSFGVEVKPSDMGRAHPSTFQVPPTSTSFSTPAQVSAPVAQETKQAPAVKTTTNASDDAVKKTTQEEADTSNKKKKEEKKQKQKKKKAVNALVIDEDEGSVEFPSREDAEFRYRLTLTKSDKIKVWLEGKSSKLQWESKELELSEIVTKENTIPGMELKDYFESFKSCLSASDGNASTSSSCDLLSLDKSGEIQLELSLAVVVFAKTLKPTYKFKLQPVKLSEMDIVNAKLRDRDEEIRELRDEVDELYEKLQALLPFQTGAVSASEPPGSTPPASGPVAFLRAVTLMSASWNQALVWHTEKSDLGGAFQVGGDYILVLQDGVYSIQVVVHHSNSFNPSSGGVLFKPQEYPAFLLKKNEDVVASCYGSSVNSVLQSSSLHHMLPLKKYDLVKVQYAGTNQAKEGSYINIYKLK